MEGGWSMVPTDNGHQLSGCSMMDGVNQATRLELIQCSWTRLSLSWSKQVTVNFKWPNVRMFVKLVCLKKL